MSYPKVQHLEAVNLIKRDPNPLGIISCLSLIKRDGSCGNDGSSYTYIHVQLYEHAGFMMQV